MKKTIITFLLGGLFFSSITAGAAYVYTARDINYQPSDENWSVNNVQEAISELKTDVSTITNKVEGIERVYKAGEVELVALVSDDSFYKDSNDKYVLSNSDTGRTLLADTSTYKSLSSTQDCIGIVGQDSVITLNNIKIIDNVQVPANTRYLSVDMGTTVVPSNFIIIETSRLGGSGSDINNILFTYNGDISKAYRGRISTIYPCSISGSTLTIDFNNTWSAYTQTFQVILMYE